MTKTTDAVTHSVLVTLTPDAAFELFAERMATWWPSEGYSLAGGTPVVESREGGRWYERTTGGDEIDFGRVLVWQRPDRLVLAWHLTPDFAVDAGKPTEVEVTFAADGDGTRVTLEHRGFEVHGEAGATMRESVGGGWPSLLEMYRAAA